MATYAETKIGEAMLAKLTTGLTFTPALPIAFENVSFTKPAGGYLEAKLFPARTVQSTLGTTGMNRHTGFFQVNVCWPANAGKTDAQEAASKIIAHFKRGTDLSREGVIVTIDAPPYAMTAFNDPDNANRLTIPVTIPYRADVPNP